MRENPKRGEGGTLSWEWLVVIRKGRSAKTIYQGGQKIVKEKSKGKESRPCEESQ